MTRVEAIGWTVAFFASGILATTVAYLAVARGMGVDPLTAQVVAVIVGFGAVTWTLARFGLKWGWTDLRWRGTGNALSGFGVGLGIGAVPAVMALALAVPAGHAAWSFDGGTVGEWGKAVAGILVLLLPAAFSEELVFRGLPYVALSRTFGRVPAAIALSVLFGAAHLGNPNVTGLAVMNVAVAGVFLSAALWLPGGIWAATGAHLGWNLTLAALGAPVSGLPFQLPMLDYTMGGPAWLTGGSFGPEGGVIATIIVGTAGLLLFRRTTPELPRPA
ncbi:MAG TPA: type II CAAX endopeptidase family protein, partial [Anaeromyxobacteraceae bacterium]|nr:type II CAAX endopeptidase family protein [Anaeromyxobacteraceae bacterium]